MAGKPRPSRHHTQVAAAGEVVRALRDLGRIERVDEALVKQFLGLAAAVDRNPEVAALWREFRATEAALRGIGVEGDAAGIAAYLDELATGTAVRDTEAG